MSIKINKIIDQLGSIESWIEVDSLDREYSAAYWNDSDEEKLKDIFWIVDEKYDKCMNYLNTSGLLQECDVAVEYIKSIPKKDLKIADLACGIGWTTAILSNIPEISEVAAIEFSIHRLDKLFPYAFDMLDGNPKKVKRYLGSFYNVKKPNNYFDVVFMAQAFHHSDQPLALLFEINRLLSPGGVVIFIGESYIGIKRMLVAMLKNLFFTKKLNLNFYDLFPPEFETGDHYYRVSDYYLFFQLLGYRVNHLVVNGASLVIKAENINSLGG